MGMAEKAKLFEPRTGFGFNSVVEYSVCLDPEMMYSRKLEMGTSGFAGER